MRDDYEERRRHLVQGLVGKEHRHLYLTNPWFHQGVLELAEMLPILVRGLALESRERGEAMEARARATEEAQGPMHWPVELNAEKEAPPQ